MMSSDRYSRIAVGRDSRLLHFQLSTERPLKVDYAKQRDSPLAGYIFTAILCDVALSLPESLIRGQRIPP